MMDSAPRLPIPIAVGIRNDSHAVLCTSVMRDLGCPVTRVSPLPNLCELIRSMGPHLVLLQCLRPDKVDAFEDWAKGSAAEFSKLCQVLILPSSTAKLWRDLFFLDAEIRASIVAIICHDELERRILTQRFSRVLRKAASDALFSFVLDELTDGDHVLVRVAKTVLIDPTRHSTLRRTLVDLGISRRSYVSAVSRAGWKPPSQYFHATRVLLAHQGLRVGCTVANMAEMIGVSSPDVLRSIFRRVAGMTPTEAKEYSPAELAGVLRDAG